MKLFLDIIKICFRVLDPLGPLTNKIKKNQNSMYVWSVGYQNSVRRVRGDHFYRNFEKILKDIDFRFMIVEKGFLIKRPSP